MDVLNFSRRGEWESVRILTSVVPFLNARIQGLDRLYRGAKENPAAFAMKGAILTAATLALMAVHDDDDRYWDLPEWDRDTYWHFWIGSEHFRIPKPFEVGAVFATIPERAWGQLSGKEGGEELRGALSRMIVSTFAFNPIPQAFMPAYDVAKNESTFKGTPIINPFMKGSTEPEYQYDERTSVNMKALAQAMPDFAPDALRSPKNLEYLVHGYFGTVGAHILAMSDAAVRGSLDMPETPTMTPSQYPLIGRFYREGESQTKYPDKFYQMLDEAEKARNKIKKVVAEGRPQDARDLSVENAGALSARIGLNKVRKQMSDYGKEIRRIYADPNMDPDEKRDRSLILNEKRNQAAKAAVERFEGYF